MITWLTGWLVGTFGTITAAFLVARLAKKMMKKKGVLPTEKNFISIFCDSKVLIARGERVPTKVVIEFDDDGDDYVYVKPGAEQDDDLKAATKKTSDKIEAMQKAHKDKACGTCLGCVIKQRVMEKIVADFGKVQAEFSAGKINKPTAIAALLIVDTEVEKIELVFGPPNQRRRPDVSIEHMPSDPSDPHIN